MTPFEEILNRSLEIHKKKREDYTTNPDSNPYENFTRANEIISWFPPEYKSFASHIGTKLARLSSLLQSGKTPNNESLDDSFLDLVTYCGLMYGFYVSRKELNEYKAKLQEAIDNYPTGGGALNPEYRKPKSSDGPDATEPVCDHLTLNKHAICIYCYKLIEQTHDSYRYEPSVQHYLLIEK